MTLNDVFIAVSSYILSGIITTAFLYRKYKKDIDEQAAQSIFDPIFVKQFYVVFTVFFYPLFLLHEGREVWKNIRVKFLLFKVRFTIWYIISRAKLRKRFSR